MNMSEDITFVETSAISGSSRELPGHGLVRWGPFLARSTERHIAALVVTNGLAALTANQEAQ
jgi:hypothetical protein